MEDRITKNGRIYLKSKCEECGNYYYRRSDKKSKYCSPICVGVQFKVDKTRICPICNSEFQYRNKTEIYCSNKCSGISKRGDVINTQCAFCGKEMNKRKWELNGSVNNFCNKECYYEYIRENPKTGEYHPNWNGGVYMQDGYKSLKQEDGSYKFEHRIVMEEYLGRELSSDEIIHHIDGNRSNNDISNLQLLSRTEHIEIHREDLIKGKF